MAYSMSGVCARRERPFRQPARPNFFSRMGLNRWRSRISISFWVFGVNVKATAMSG
ncbi:hypothetical protein JOD82_005620 [Paenibacillus sp. 1182]|nr:hypothetical protein [Paenibacillus sp. 1182]